MIDDMKDRPNAFEKQFDKKTKCPIFFYNLLSSQILTPLNLTLI